jgi:hypothetical protein
MPKARLAVLVVLSVTAACGPTLKDGADMSIDIDVTHEGEACDAEGASSECRFDGSDGYEFCRTDWSNMNGVWSACMTESCDEQGASRACEGGTQYCTSHQLDGQTMWLWGECTGELECTPGERRDCGFPPELEIYAVCVLDDGGVPQLDPSACNTPLVLSFGDAVEFAPAPAAAADFDIHGGPGVCVRADWPSAATPWLALDLDKSGNIDGGHELFGSGTRLAAGTGSPNGFVALAQLDSDSDGKISAGDARFGELVLWADHDGDRRSSGWEVLPLASFEIVEISLDYGSRRECDAAGNCGVERASFVYRQGGRARVGEVVDVHLACE